MPALFPKTNPEDARVVTPSNEGSQLGEGNSMLDFPNMPSGSVHGKVPKGGQVGEVLTKSSDLDYEFEWLNSEGASAVNSVTLVRIHPDGDTSGDMSLQEAFERYSRSFSTVSVNNNSLWDTNLRFELLPGTHTIDTNVVNKFYSAAPFSMYGILPNGNPNTDHTATVIRTSVTNGFIEMSFQSRLAEIYNLTMEVNLYIFNSPQVILGSNVLASGTARFNRDMVLENVIAYTYTNLEFSRNILLRRSNLSSVGGKFTLDARWSAAAYPGAPRYLIADERSYISCNVPMDIYLDAPQSVSPVYVRAASAMDIAGFGSLTALGGMSQPIVSVENSSVKGCNKAIVRSTPGNLGGFPSVLNLNTNGSFSNFLNVTRLIN